MNVIKAINHPVIKSFRVILGGNILTQLVGLASYSILARLFTTTDFGVSGLFISLAYVCSIVQSGQIYWGLFKEHDSEKQHECYIDSLNFTFLMTPILLLVAGVLVAYNFRGLGWLLLLVPIFSLIYSLLEINKTFLNSQGEYKKTIHQTFFSRTFGQVLKIIFFYFSKGPLSLILGELLGNLLVIRRTFKQFSFKKMTFKVYRKYQDTILYYTPINFFNLVIQEMPVILSSYVFGFKESGAFFLLNRLIISPMTLVGNSYASSQIKKMNSLREDPKGKNRFLFKSYFSLLVIGFIPAVVIYFWGYELFSLFLGPGHEEAAKLSVLIAFLLPFRLIKALGIISSVNSDLHREALIIRSFQFLMICFLPFFFKELGFAAMMLTLLSLDTVVDIVLSVLGLLKTSK